MKQKLIALILLVLGILFGLGFIFYYFYMRVWAIVVDIENFDEVKKYQIIAHSKSTTIKHKSECVSNPCRLERLPASQYSVTLTADGYQNENFSQRLKAWEIFEVKKKFLKDTKLVVLTQKIPKQDFVSQKQLAEQKISLLREKKLYEDVKETPYEKRLYVYNSAGIEKIKFWEYDVFSLFGEERFEDIEVKKSKNSDDFLFILPTRFVWVWKNFTQNISLDFAIDIKYFKESSPGEKIIVTDKWSFTFDIASKKLSYFSLFSDYINTPEGVIGLVSPEDTQRKINLWIEQEGSVLVYYHQKSKEKKVIYTSSWTIDALYKNNEKYLVEISGSVYEIVNL